MASLSLPVPAFLHNVRRLHSRLADLGPQIAHGGMVEEIAYDHAVLVQAAAQFQATVETLTTLLGPHAEIGVITLDAEETALLAQALVIEGSIDRRYFAARRASRASGAA